MKKIEKNKKLSTVIITQILIIVATIAFLFPIFNEIKLGLDLKGGFEVLYEVEPLDGEKLTWDMLNSTYKTISRRVDVLGVSEPDISIEGKNKIRVKLAGESSESARNILSTTANITFRDTNDNLLMNSNVLSGAKSGRNSQDGMPVVSLSVKNKDKFYEVTKSISQKENNTIVIWLDYDPSLDSFATEQSKCGSLSDSRCLSAASVKQGFNSDVYIEGNFSEEEASTLAELINSGSMPTKLKEISSKDVDASFGLNSLNKTIIAGIVGVAIIMLVLILIYRFSGIVASISMIIYTFAVFLTFYLVGGVLTLPGIAALVLGIGMAVDACVISFERIKDELKLGRSLKAAYKEGNKMSFVTILDANLTTLIVAIILFIFGESSVKGFATMLIINIIITILIMVYINRGILNSFIKTGKFDNKYKLLFGMKDDEIHEITKINKQEVLKETKIKMDFVKNRKAFFITSSLIIIIGCVYTLLNGFNLGIDYRGGSNITISSDLNLDIKKIEKDLTKYKINDIEYTNDEKGVYVTIDKTLTKEEVKEVSDTLKDKYEAKTEVGVVSNVVKKELTKNAILSIILASLGIIIYVTFRFSFNYAFSAVVALFHDVLFVIAVFSIFRIEVSTIFIAAVLSILGYSINDTIVTFDRIKENIKNIYNDNVPNKKELINVVNLSIRQTVIRSIITSLTTIIPVVVLLIMGNQQINNFNIAMLVGLIVGSYSSIFIASQLWLELEKKHVGKKKNKKGFFELEDDELDEKVIHDINK